MGILNLNKRALVVLFMISNLFFSCTNDKNKECSYLNLRSSISIYNFQPNDTAIKEAYLLVYDKNGFINKIDSITPNNIINHHKRNNFKNKVNFKFDERNINTEHNYILVTNRNTRYMISDYTFKQISRKLLFGTIKEYCLVETVKVNNDYVNEVGGILRFPKELGIPLE
ncbi:hypothetical protein [Tenacibaculum discolor]|uniref:hypothetical protein n=1 Tax=Tenacibaculum discolor TaxID=361581 RepID=UPI003F799FC3